MAMEHVEYQVRGYGVKNLNLALFSISWFTEMPGGGFFFRWRLSYPYTTDLV
jgi:hypothetical protein